MTLWDHQMTAGGLQLSSTVVNVLNKTFSDR